MTSVFALFSLPQSNGFTALKSSPSNSIDDGLASRKAPRLDSDLDSASASRSNRDNAAKGPVQLKLVGYYAERSAEKASFLPLKRCIEILLEKDNHDPLPLTYSGIYSMCRSMVCEAGFGDQLYSDIRIELEKCVGGIATQLEQKELSKEDYIPWLTKFVEYCGWFEKQVSLVSSLFTYLDQVHVHANSHLHTIRELAFGQFGDRIFNNRIIGVKLLDGTKSLINDERHLWLATPSNRALMSKIVSHLTTHNNYPSFEKNYLAFTRDYYLEESRKQREANKNAREFFKFVDKRIEYEDGLSTEVLSVGSWSVVRETTERALMEGRGEWLANEALSSLLAEKDLKTLGKMYKLFYKVGALHLLRVSFRAHVSNTVKHIVSDPQLDDSMVQRLLEFKASADQAISTSFVDESTSPTSATSSTSPSQSTSTTISPTPSKDFLYALDEGFRTGFKHRRAKPAELIAKHLDKLMRKGQGGRSDIEFRGLLDRVLELYKYTDDKDVFRMFYHRGLAKRLLLGRSASDDFEKEMLKKLKDHYDAEFGMAEDMFKDLSLSRDMMKDFHARLGSNSPGNNLTAMVLQRSAWPFSVSKTTIDLPPKMEEDLEKFTQYYKNKHQGRILNWDHALGTVTLKARFIPGDKELSVSLYQAVILLMFNEAEEMPFGDIKAQVRLEDAELRRTLQSLACGKLRVLKKVPMSRDVADNDVFKFNSEFSDPRPKVHINSIQAKVTAEESKRTHDSVEGDRKHYLDAAIVRIMKARKQMKLEELTTETINAVKAHFTPDVGVIKQRIEGLVEGEYLARDEADKRVFRYLA